METNLPQRRILNNICRHISLKGVEISCLLQSGLNFLTYFYRMEKPGKYHRKQEMKVNTTTEATGISHILFYCMRRRPIHFYYILPQIYNLSLRRKISNWEHYTKYLTRIPQNCHLNIESLWNSKSQEEIWKLSVVS